MAIGTYTLEQTLGPEDYAGGFVSGGWWASSLAFNGDGTVMVCGCQTYEGSTDPVMTGALFTYDRVGDAWVQRGDIFVGPDANAEFAFAFGYNCISLSDDGNTLVVGQPQYPYSAGTAYTGRVLVYERASDTWSLVTVLSRPGGATINDKFGAAVSISGDGQTIVAGGPYLQNSGNPWGGLYTFKFVAGNWTWVGTLLAEQVGTELYYGHAAALNYDGTVLAVGHWFFGQDQAPGYVSNGAVWLYDASGSDWVLRYRVDGPHATYNAWFGAGVCLNDAGDVLLVGEEQYNKPATYTPDPVAITADTWPHLAVSYDGSTLRMFIDGALIASSVATYERYNPGETAGFYGFTTIPGDSGWLDEIRVTVGHARYTEAFSAPTAAYISSSDPLAAYVVWASHCEGTDGSHVLVDDSGNGLDITFSPDGNVDYGQKAFGDSSFEFPSYDAFADLDASVQIDSTPWCVEAMFRVSSSAGAGLYVLYIDSNSEFLVTDALVPQFSWYDGGDGDDHLLNGPGGALLTPAVTAVGRAALYELGPSSATEVAEFLPSTLDDGLSFGRSVAMARETLDRVAVFCPPFSHFFLPPRAEWLDVFALDEEPPEPPEPEPEPEPIPRALADEPCACGSLTVRTGSPSSLLAKGAGTAGVARLRIGVGSASTLLSGPALGAGLSSACRRS
jgi:hypothetical protein